MVIFQFPNLHQNNITIIYGSNVDSTFFLAVFTAVLAFATIFLAITSNINSRKNRRMDFLLKQLENFYSPFQEYLEELRKNDFKQNRNSKRKLKYLETNQSHLPDPGMLWKFKTHISNIEGLKIHPDYEIEYLKQDLMLLEDVKSDKMDKILELYKIFGTKREFIKNRIEFKKFIKEIEDAHKSKVIVVGKVKK